MKKFIVAMIIVCLSASFCSSAMARGRYRSNGRFRPTPPPAAQPALAPDKQVTPVPEPAPAVQPAPAADNQVTPAPEPRPAAQPAPQRTQHAPQPAPRRGRRIRPSVGIGIGPRGVGIGIGIGPVGICIPL